jgi:hypothetical protein
VAFTRTAAQPPALQLRVLVVESEVLDLEWSSPCGADVSDRRARQHLLTAVALDKRLWPGRTPEQLPPAKEVTLRMYANGRQHRGYSLISGDHEVFTAAIPILVAWARKQCG